MAKKLFADAIYTSPTNALAALNTIAADMADKFALALPDLLRNNLPEYVESGETYPALGMDDAGQIAMNDPSAAACLAIVVTYDSPEKAIPQREGDALALPLAVHLLNLPKPSEVLTSAKLAETREKLVASYLLTTARRIARNDLDGKAPLVTDRFGLLLSAAARSSGAKIEQSYTIMFPAIQKTILDRVAQVADAMAAAKQFTNKRALEATFSKARLDRKTLKECFQSEQAAAYHFPTMPQAQWQHLLRLAIAQAPAFRITKPMRGADGKTLKSTDPTTGKETIQRETVTLALAPAIFQQWLDTRHEVTHNPDPETAVTFTFDGMTA